MPKVYARRRLSVLAAFTGLIAMVGIFNGPTASAALPTPVTALGTNGTASIGEIDLGCVVGPDARSWGFMRKPGGGL
ncbi:hypothetical protein OG762_13040 [Streptomyces sp. NBC_01136]|uniref:hypothetical protein n=1 Tax=unclassified Streptomyces TaxID=2593676 RepID=UPI00324C8879|nr:hypothetical protein OG762_13040 [Streptomyces sp. NBC_01136]